ncbi:MurR/RpiR family transcriptional regulator [Neptunomonas antarctica]|uniref:Transcriptional regulator, RpiR family n=1 Tax=Neptunomonas antarctica TaxID=619304 RepID=A0A1N7NDW3_9GAMM|nr:MurR/RpiR family transcriptional regulator [Neptunomonas antarctica]SIS96421.1 transcriptional regulator, RpiR family [Neptunomonas antarctica]
MNDAPAKHDNSHTIAELLRSQLNKFSPAEMKIVNHLQANYPMSGLVSITELSENCGVSTPTVMRTLKKIDYSSFPTFQKALKDELQQTLSDPIAKHDKWATDAPESHVLNKVADTVTTNLRHSLNQISHEQFDAIIDLLAQQDQALHIVGGRITSAFARYLNTHLEVIRENVYLFPEAVALWPHHMLKIKPNDVMIVFDVRRYEQDLITISKLADTRGAKIILFTDQWLSPIAGYATHTLPIRIEGKSGWDSGVVTLFFAEAIVVALEEKLWAQTSARMRELEDMFDLTERFKKRME